LSSFFLFPAFWLRVFAIFVGVVVNCGFFCDAATLFAAKSALAQLLITEVLHSPFRWARPAKKTTGQDSKAGNYWRTDYEAGDGDY
jgi:hypothetical protein